MNLTAKKFWKEMNRMYDRAIMLVLVILLLIVVYALYDAWYVYSHAASDLSKYKPIPGQSSTEDSPITENMVGWLTIDDTKIDYPIMQGDDNTRYLNINPYGEYSLSGSIFLDSRCSSDFSDSYSLIYGHHMDLGVMFGALDDFLDEDYLREHESGTLMVGRNAEKTYELSVFASMKASAKDKMLFEFADNETVAAYIEQNADVYVNTRPDESGGETDYGTESADEADTEQIHSSEESRILALSTCAGAATEERTLVFCYIVDK